MRLGIGKRHSRKWIIVLLCLLILFIVHILFKRAEPSFVAQCSNYSNTAFTDLVNKCVVRAANQSRFDNLYEIIADSQSNVKVVKANTARLNIAVSSLMIDIQNTLNADYPANVYVPLGSLSGYSLLSSYGPVIPIKVIPISVVNSSYDESFDSAGINQVRHRINLKVTVDMLYKGYLMHETERIETTIPISDTVISGNVPEYYGNEWELNE